MSTNKKCFFTYKYYYAHVFEIVDMDKYGLIDFLSNYINCSFYISPLHSAKEDRTAHYHVLFATDNRSFSLGFGRCKRISNPGMFIQMCQYDSHSDCFGYFHLV